MWIPRWLRAHTDAVHTELSGIKEVLQDQKAAIDSAAKTYRDERRDEPRIVIAPAPTDDERKKASTEKKKDRSIQRVIAAGTWVMAIGALVYAGIAAHQASLMRQSIDQSEQAMQLDEGAWVTVSDIKRIDTPGGFDVVIWFTNTGKTPGRNFRVRLSGEPVPKGQRPTAQEVMLPGVGLIAPNGTYHSSLTSGGFYDTQKSNLVIHGRVDYDDLSGPHWTAFCYLWMPEASRKQGSFAPCEFGNDIDDRTRGKG
jgi:hypothetical protein